MYALWAKSSAMPVFVGTQLQPLVYLSCMAALVLYWQSRVGLPGLKFVLSGPIWKRYAAPDIDKGGGC